MIAESRTRIGKKKEIRNPGEVALESGKSDWGFTRFRT
ncbi:hypothetical protein LEP1GSC047_2887 [Leptospira inadai serovar Lyme str. 10]|uniref:Uncharacterized protein n=1 Tax=Leptospira inadai serovar Lyme str. 10 TaxID=1049790 RepID=V6HVN3_9LEPT|nr:hypothetical protein LEP1GSC047_2887 [Leptospira inadai serovar Lyme str. 10]